MPLVEVPVPADVSPLPPEVDRFVREADRRIERFQRDARVPAFVPSDFPGAYRVLRSLARSTLPRGHQFCEWGSGYGAVTLLAALLEYDSCGIEIDGDLVDEARRLADDFELPAEFVRGSFVPRGAEDWLASAGQYAWLTTDGDDAYDDLGLGPADFDVVFAYPWPDEEAATADLFARYAGPGAMLVTYHGGDFRVRRKVAGRPARGRRRANPERR